MNTSSQSISTLFRHLDLPSQPPHIDQYIAEYQSLPEDSLLNKVIQWSELKINFLRGGADSTEISLLISQQYRQAKH